jgi:hypothetical protein
MTKSRELFVQIVLDGRSRLKRQSFLGFALKDRIYPYQLTADVGFLKIRR